MALSRIPNLRVSPVFWLDAVIEGYSEEFLETFMNHLKVAHPHSRVSAKVRTALAPMTLCPPFASSSFFLCFFPPHRSMRGCMMERTKGGHRVAAERHFVLASALGAPLRSAVKGRDVKSSACNSD